MPFWFMIAPALAWNTTTEGWDRPIRWCADADVRDAVEDAWSVWQSASGCVTLETEEVEDCDEADLTFSGGTDSSGELCEPGSPCTIDMGGDDCSGDASGYVVHQLGHALGLQHPCEEGGECDEVEQQSLMSWDNPGDCAATTLSVDDFEALSSLYGPGAVYVEPDNVLVAAVDAEVCLSPDLTDDSLSASFSWSLGDGTTAEGETVCHTYTDDLSAWISLSYAYPAECGVWSREHAQWGQILVGNPIDTPDKEASETGCATGPVGAGGLLFGLFGLMWRRRR